MGLMIGMAFSATFSNMVSEKRLEQIMHIFNPILGTAMIIVILNLGSPLDYHLIMGAGLFTEAKNYDICLNSSSVGIERCVELIRDAYQRSKKTTEEA